MSAPNNVTRERLSLICDFPAPGAMGTGQLLGLGRLGNMDGGAEPASLAGYGSEDRILNRGRLPQVHCPVSPAKRDAALLARVRAVLKPSGPSLVQEGVSTAPLPFESHKRPLASRHFDFGDADGKLRRLLEKNAVCQVRLRS